MSSPINTESRNFTSFLFLSPLSNVSPFDWKLSPRNVSSIRPSLRRHTFFLLLVLILDLQGATFTEGAFSIEREGRSSDRVGTEKSHMLPKPKTLTSSSARSSVVGTKRYQPAEDSFSTSPPQRTGRFTHAIKHGPMEGLNSEHTKKIIRQEAIIHEDSVSAIPSLGKTELSEFNAIHSSRSIQRSQADNKTIEISNIGGYTFDDSERFMGEERIGGNLDRVRVKSRTRDFSLGNEENWKGREKVSGGEERIGRNSAEDSVLLRDGNSFVDSNQNLNEAVTGSNKFESVRTVTKNPTGNERNIGGNSAEGLVSLRSENSFLNNEDNWNGTENRLENSGNDGFDNFQTITKKPTRKEKKTDRILVEGSVSTRAGNSSFNNEKNWNEITAGSSNSVSDGFESFQKFTKKPNGKKEKIDRISAEDSSSIRAENSSLNIEENWNESIAVSPNIVSHGVSRFQKIRKKPTKKEKKIGRKSTEGPWTLSPEKPTLKNQVIWNSTITDSQYTINDEFDRFQNSTIPANRKSNALFPPKESPSFPSPFTIINKLIRAKRIGRNSVLVSSSPENSSINIEETVNETVPAASVNDGFESPEKFPGKSTYKPPAPPPASPVEKYDRRHFGPPRLENPEEPSKETSEATGSSSAASHAFPFSSYFTDSSSSTFTSSSSAQLPNLANRPEIRVDGASGSNHNRDDDEDDDDDDAAIVDKPVNQRESGIRSGEEFNLDNKPDGNEVNVVSVTIDRFHDQAVTKPSTNADGFEPPQSSTAIFKLSDLQHRKLTTMQPHDIIDAAGAAPEGTSASRHKLVDKLELTILGLFELTQGSEPRPEGPSELQAARLAVDRINDMGALPNIHLRLIHNDTRCDPGVAVDRFFHALYTSKNTSIMPLLLGTACSEVTETLAKIVPYWNIVQVSYGSTAPALSDPTEFPLFVRTVAPDSSHNPARISLIKHFGWDTVAALSQNGDMYSLAVNDLVTELEQANITCTATITFGENDYKEQLRSLKELDTRIIIGSFSPGLAPRLFCEAWKLGMRGGDYAWILPGETIDLSGMTGDWWHSGPEDCTPPQLSQTLDGLIIVKSYGTGLAEQPSYSGLTTAEFTSELAKRGVTLSRYAGQTYDAVWSMALALGKLETFLNQRNSSIAQYSHSRKDVAYHLLEELKGLNFLGVSGPVSFDGADRVGITAFYQMHGHVVRRVALYTPEDGQLTMNCAGCARTRWPGEHPPVARRVFQFRMVTIDYAAFLAVTCLASIGVTLALSFLAFNLHFRKHKSIKLSSPRLNNMAAVGCALVYGAVILLGLDHATLSDSNGYFPTICTARAYLLSAGFSLAFGSMFTKTYRVHRIFTRSRSGVVKNKLLQDTQLISLICVLLLIDCLVVTLWVTLDPMQRDLRNLTLEINPQDRSVIYQPQVEVCRSQHTNGWLAALYAYKGLLLIVGVYMAWETRHVKIPALNDSQYIGMSVYSVVITSGIVVVLANLMSDRATLAFVTITTLILASTTATLALLFLPQLANILAGERADPVVQSLGLKIECNTRRFVTDDSRELQYRVEVQNRVYRREMAQLELELARLEKQLGQEPVEPSHASSSASIPQRNPSIGGGLPLLLLSVLPPVIPRASWPSADPSGMRRGTVAFSSQPDLEPDGPRRSLADIYKLQWRRDTEGPSRLGVFQRLFSLFGSRPSSRKTSTASFTGVASALRVHMGYIAGLVPGTKASSSCQVNVQGIRTPHPRCGSGPIISITSEEDRRLSLGLRRKESSEPRVNFSLPSKSNASQSSSRERIKGSPRFPHRIVPANSLSAIASGSMTTAHQRWHSMEDASKQKIFSCTPRGSAYGPSYDVWATRERGIPLSEFDDRTGIRKVPDSLALTIPSDSKVSPDDALLGSDLRKLFRENSTTFCVNDEVAPLDVNTKNLKIVPSPRTSPTKLTLTTTPETESRFARTSTNDSVQDTQFSVGNESKNSHLALSKSKVVVICENNGHCMGPEFLLKATSSSLELSNEEAQPIDEESVKKRED